VTYQARAVLVTGMKYITLNAKGVATIPFFRVGVWEGSFPTFQLLVLLGLDT
jgi:hypothetical protein